MIWSGGGGCGDKGNIHKSAREVSWWFVVEQCSWKAERFRWTSQLPSWFWVGLCATVRQALLCLLILYFHILLTHQGLFKSSYVYVCCSFLLPIIPSCFCSHSKCSKTSRYHQWHVIRLTHKHPRPTLLHWFLFPFSVLFYTRLFSSFVVLCAYIISNPSSILLLLVCNQKSRVVVY